MTITVSPGLGNSSLSLVLVLSHVSDVLRVNKLRVSDLLLVAESLEQPRRRQLEALARLLSLVSSGDIAGALQRLADPEEAYLIIEGARVLEEELARKPSPVASRLAEIAKSVGSEGLILVAVILYLEAAARLIAARLGHPVSLRDAALVASIASGGQSSLPDGLFDHKLCFPRRECPLVPLSEVKLLLWAEQVWRGVVAAFEQAPIKDIYYDKVERPQLEAIMRDLIGELPGVKILNRPGKLEPLRDTTYVIYDNTDSAVSSLVASSTAIPIPVFREGGTSLEDVWLSRYSGRLVAAVRDMLVSAPLYAMLRATQLLREISLPGTVTLEISRGELVLGMPGSGEPLRESLTRAAKRFREALLPRVAGARSLEDLDKNLVAAIHRFYYCRA